MYNFLANLLLFCSVVCVCVAFQASNSRLATTSRWSRLGSTLLEVGPSASLKSFDYKNNDKLPWLPQGYSTWKWRDYSINYVDLGGSDDSSSSKPPLLLIHGFGASVYHWRYNIPVLARDFHVYAIDLLGFGLSEKPIVDYSAELWRDQALAFISEVIQKGKSGKDAKPVVIAGNSLGGFTALYAAADARATQGPNKLINGCILLNAAGRFKSEDDGDKEEEKNSFVEAVKAAVQRFVIGVSFIYTKQPLRIAQVLRQVYPVDPSNVDDELVSSIQFPAQDPNAAEVFYRVIARNGNGPPKTVDELLETLQVPLLLLWGQMDPWIRPQAADKIQALFPKALRVNVNGGNNNKYIMSCFVYATPLSHLAFSFASPLPHTHTQLLRSTYQVTAHTTRFHKM